eukprot:531439_1
MTMTCQSDTDYRNAYDATFTAYIGENEVFEQFMSGIYSVHSSGNEDRMFKFDWCKQENEAVIIESTIQPSVTIYDETWTRTCSDYNEGNAAMVALHSYHSNDKEDREFLWTCGLLDTSKYTLTDCVSSSDYENAYDGILDFECENDGVIRSVTSIHSNTHEDRRFKFECCSVEVDVSDKICWLGGTAATCNDWTWNDGTDWDYDPTWASSHGCGPLSCLVPNGYPSYDPEYSGIEPISGVINDCDESDVCYPICDHQLECEAPKQFVWEELMASDTDKPEASITTLEVDATTLTLSIEVEAEYLANSAADDNGYEYGTTYVIDFE